MIRSLSLAVALCLTACQIEHGVFIDTREQDIIEVFDVAGADTDVVFFADNSFSMQRDLIRLGGSFEDFLRRIDDANPNWRVITVTGDQGCSTSGVLTGETPDVVDKFSQGVQTAPDDSNSDEWGLFIVRQAVLNSAPGLCNEGFLRPEATLHAVFMSDEADTSPGYEAGGRYWQDYVTAITAAKGDTSKVRFSAIVGPSNGSCNTAEPGLGYIDAAQATGGEVVSICDDWTESIEILADASIQQDTFHLQHEPLVETIAVRVNSEDRLTGWTYELESNSIVFTENIPQGRDEVVVDYRGLVEFETDEDPDA